ELGDLGGIDISSGPSTEYELKRSRLGDVQISNSATDSSDDAYIYADYHLNQYLRQTNVAITKALYDGSNQIEWRLIVSGDDRFGDDRRYELDDDILVFAWERHLQLGIAKHSPDVLETVVLGVRTLDDFASMYARYEQMVSQAARLAFYATTFWYMGGN